MISRAAGVFTAKWSFAVPNRLERRAGLAIPAPAAPLHFDKWIAGPWVARDFVLGARSVARALARGGHGESAAVSPRVRTGLDVGIQAHLPRKSFKGSPSLNTFPPYSLCFAFSFFKHLIITLINTFWDNSSWPPSNLNQHLLAYCRVCIVC